MTDRDGSDRVTVVTPRSRLTVETFGRLRDEVQELVSRGCRRVVVNLSAVRDIDSIGISELVRVHVMLQRHRGRLAFSDVQPRVIELLKMTRLHGVLDIHPGEASAVERLALGGDSGDSRASGETSEAPG